VLQHQQQAYPPPEAVILWLFLDLVLEWDDHKRLGMPLCNGKKISNF
jgi:hypothetical protein